MTSAAATVRHSLANLLRNLRAGLRLAAFLRVERLQFRIDLPQLLLLFAVVWVRFVSQESEKSDT